MAKYFTLEKIEQIAKKIFSPHNSKKIEVKLDTDLLTVRIFKKSILNGWFSLIEIKRFYQECEKYKLVSFLYSWEMTSLDLDNNEYIDINFHLI